MSSTPHDDLFKATFSHKEEVAALVESYLSKELAEQLDLSTLRQEATSYVTEELKQYFSDMVYSCAWKGSTQKARVVLLLEHKSYQSGNIHVQLLRYLAQCYHLQHEGGQALELVIPVVIYHGRKAWVHRAFADYFQLPTDGLRQYLPAFSYELIDLNRHTAEWIITRQTGRFLQSTFLVFKHKNNKAAIRQFSKEIFIFVEQRVLTQEEKAVFLRQILTYIFTAFRFKREEFTELVKQLPAMTQILKGSLYEQLIEEGMEKGLEKGMEKGMEKGVLFNAINDDIDLMGRLIAQSLPVSAVQAITLLPTGFIGAFMGQFTEAKYLALRTAALDLRSCKELEDMRNALAAAFKIYGLGHEEIDAYLKHINSANNPNPSGLG